MLDQLPDEPSAPNRPSLVSCPNCHAPCPLGFSSSTTCVSCRTEIPLGADVCRDRDARRAAHRKRRQADVVWQRALKAQARWWRAPYFIAPISYAAPFAAAAVGYEFGYRDGRYGQAGFLWLVGIGLVHFLTSALLETRKVEQLRGLLLARRLTEADDGPLSCRVCAAPLSPEPDVLDCSCDHCGADNILGPITSRAETMAARPDIYDAEAAYLEVYGDEVNQRASRLYPLTIFLGFVVLAMLTFYAVEAPRVKLPQ